MKPTIFYSAIILALLLLNGINSFGQTKITGTVKTPRNKAIKGVNIAIKDSYDGTITDSLGQFSFTTFEKGNQQISFSAMGYMLVEQPIDLSPKEIYLTITLKQDLTELETVVITAGTFEASDKKRAAALLEPLDIVTTASANGDITGALKSLPGTQQVGETEGLFVRGGTATETKIFIDGTLVNKFFHSSVPNVAQFGRFNPFLFKGTVFSTGGYSALYGQALSSALILESIDLPELSSVDLGLSVIGGSVGYQKLAKNKKASYGINYDYTNIGLATKLFNTPQDYSQAPEYHNVEANFRIKTSNNGMLKYYGYFNGSRLDFTVPSLDTLNYLDRYGIKNKNQYHNLSYKENFGHGWKWNIGISYTFNEDKIDGNLYNSQQQEVNLNGLETKNFDVVNTSHFTNAKTVFEKRIFGRNILRFGSEINYSKEETLYTAYNGIEYPSNLTQHVMAGFAETDIYFTANWAAKIGGRLERASVLKKTNLAPRLSIAYKMDRFSQASLAYGVFYQNPESKYLPSPVALDFLKATHYIAQYQYNKNKQSFRTEIFYKNYHSLLKTDIINFAERGINNNGKGDAKGFEIFWRDKRTLPNVDYWISYSYLDTKRDFLNFPVAITPNFAAKHTASFIIKRFVQNWKMNVNGSYNFASGRPYYRIIHNGSEFEFADKGVTPNYHNVSFSFNYLPFIGKKNPKTFPVWVLQFSNVLNTNHVYGYEYSYNGYRKQAIHPSSRLFVFLGVFLTIGADRSEDIINRTL